MATNLDKLKAEIAEMSAEEFVYFVYHEPCHSMNLKKDYNCRSVSCWDCFIKWLNSESEEKE